MRTPNDPERQDQAQRVSKSPVLILKLFEHLYWADTRFLEALQALEEARLSEVRRIASHLIAAERVWLMRLQDEDAVGHPIWPDWSLAELLSAASSVRKEYERFLAGITEAELEREISYTNSSGTAFKNQVADILAHVALHGSYHRGQIANAVRRSGAEPMNTDYITFVRELS